MMVSVSMITYGHEHYIEEAINGVLMQECDFEIELIIADDCSPDNTETVVRKIQNTHPRGSWIKYTRYAENIGIANNFAWSLLAGKGEYIAICEGDDYWTDPNKLQKQVDFLKSHSDFSMVCHSSNEVDAKGNVFKVATRSDDIIDLSTVFEEGWFIRTASILFRKEVLSKGFPDFFYKAYSTDYILQVMILKNGNCKYLPEVMSAYRRHDGGVSQAIPGLQVKRWIKKLSLLDQLDRFTNFKYTQQVKKQKNDIEKSISFYCLRYPSLMREIGGRMYMKNIFSILLIKKLYEKINAKLNTKK